jgi:hypothetical protein
MPQTRLILIATFGLLVLGVLVVLWYPSTEYPQDYSATAKGSPEYAAQWRDALTQFSDPDHAAAKHPEVSVQRFHNGEWVFGVCRDSHSHADGGTIVVKDSNGKVRAFFGHVCGGGFLDGRMALTHSLSEFYQFFETGQFEFREYHF